MSDYYWHVYTVDQHGDETYHDLGTDDPLTIGEPIPLPNGPWIVFSVTHHAGDDRATAVLRRPPLVYRLMFDARGGGEPTALDHLGELRVGHVFRAHGRVWRVDRIRQATERQDPYAGYTTCVDVEA